VLYGLHPVREALRARRRDLHALWIREGASRADLERLAAERGVPVKTVSREMLEASIPLGAQAQGVGLVAGPLPEFGPEIVRVDAGEPDRQPVARPPIWVALDGVEDPQNVGAIARVADSAGAAGLVMAQRRAAPMTPAVARASAGAIEWLPIVRVSNLARALADFRSKGFWSLGTTANEGTGLYELEDRLLEGPLVVVLGAEGRGIRPGVLREIDHRVRIPMLGGVDSLNVATAAAVLLYDLVRRAKESRQ
jgi:23S rRNA (guanosine2251-2'-O)-methyltransferase